MKRTKVAIVLAAIVAASAPAVAHAQGPSDQAIAEARSHYSRGMELYNEGDYRLALIEFQRANDLAPSAKVLYNIGEVYYQLNEYAQAYRTLTRYLDMVGSDISPQKRADVEHELQTLRTRTATITIKLNVPEADVSVDDFSFGKTKNGTELLVDAGRRKITIARAGLITETRTLTLAGTDQAEVAVVLKAPPPPPQVAPAPEPSYTWVGWAATGVLAAGAVTTGILTLNAQSKLEADRTGYVPTSEQDGRDRLQSREDTVRTYGIVTDVLIGATLVTAGVALYFTLTGNSPSKSRANAGPGSLRVTF